MVLTFVNPLFDDIYLAYT